MTVHSPVCVLIFKTLITLFPALPDVLACTVTCRQFPNLTFAPRKTCHVGSNLTLHSYHVTAMTSIHDVFLRCKCFFQKFSGFLGFALFLGYFRSDKLVFMNTTDSVKNHPLSAPSNGFSNCSDRYYPLTRPLSTSVHARFELFGTSVSRNHWYCAEQ